MLVAGAQGAADVGNVFNDVVENNHVECLVRAQSVREIALADLEAALCGLAAHFGIRLDADGVERGDDRRAARRCGVLDDFR
ncbi:hypothetical protein GCM10007388_01970 [Pseudoduganella plicata]|uniref:Uncharacterized protein n=1 Tax=Pseudoduganella plicata TaxID=321984 RepID=A0AA88C9V0_9BURK|nr:hypothetical protein GCM10007388_01970 [Pseudoduganella plicata]